MPDFQSGVKYGAQGAAIGTSIAPGIGTAIGGGLGFLAGLFGGGNDEEERQRRFQEFLRTLAAERKRKVEEVMKRTSGLTQQATAAAGRRARASGRPDQAESYILPAAQQATRAGTEAIGPTLDYYDRKRVESEADFAGRPIEPNTLDYLVEAGGAVGNIFQNQRLIEQIGKMGGTNTPVTDQEGTAVNYDYTAPSDAIGSGTGMGVAAPTPGMESLTSTTPAGQISAHRKRNMSYSPLFDDNYLNSLYG
jgi:hypothetical protein